MYFKSRMNFQDWNTVGWDKRGEKGKNESDKTYMSNQMRKGNVVQVNKPKPANQNQVNVVTNAKKIEKEEDTFKHKLVGNDVGKRITTARCEKKLTQKELAGFLSLPVKTIQEFESGKAIYNAVVLNKIEKYLGCRVRD